MPLSTVISTSAPLRQRQVDDRRREAVAVHARGRAPRSAACRRARRAAPGRAARRRRRWRRRSRSRRRRRCVLRAAIASARKSRGGLRRRAGRPAAAGAPAPSSSSSPRRTPRAGEQARQQRVHAGLLERPDGARRRVAQCQHGGRGAWSAAWRGLVTMPPARCARTAPASAGAGAASSERGACRSAARARSPHKVSVTGHRLRAVPAAPQRPGVERAPGLGPAAQSCASSGARSGRRPARPRCRSARAAHRSR